VSLIIAFYL